jgi:hypothetical protein
MWSTSYGLPGRAVPLDLLDDPYQTTSHSPVEPVSLPIPRRGTTPDSCLLQRDYGSVCEGRNRRTRRRSPCSSITLDKDQRAPVAPSQSQRLDLCSGARLIDDEAGSGLRVADGHSLHRWRRTKLPAVVLNARRCTPRMTRVTRSVGQDDQPDIGSCHAHPHPQYRTVDRQTRRARTRSGGRCGIQHGREST